MKTFNTVQYLHSKFNFFYIVLHSALNQHTRKHSFHFFQDTARLLITWWRANIEQKSQRANHDWTNRALVHYLPPHYPCGALSGIVVILAKHILALRAFSAIIRSFHSTWWWCLLKNQANNSQKYSLSKWGYISWFIWHLVWCSCI